MPVEALPELSAYRDLVVAWAKLIWARENPSRRRIPRRFDESFKLTLDGLGEGSVAAVLNRSQPAMQFELFDCFEKARDEFNALLSAAQNDNDDAVRRALPKQLFVQFNRLGRKLLDKDSIEFRTDSTSPGPTYTKATRMRVMRIVGLSYEDDVDLEGVVSEARRAGERFQLDLDDGSTINVCCEEDTFPAATWAFHANQRVRVRGSGTRSSDGVLLKVTSVDEVQPLGPSGALSKIDVQIEDLRGLKSGWLDGDGERIDSPGLDWLAAVLNRLVRSEMLPFPFLYPTIEGGVRAEWSTTDFEVSATFDVVARSVEMLATDVRTGKFESEDFSDLCSPLEEKPMAEFLVRFVQGEEIVRCVQGEDPDDD